jgi:hypothetical protein
LIHANSQLFLKPLFVHDFAAIVQWGVRPGKQLGQEPKKSELLQVAKGHVNNIRNRGKGKWPIDEKKILVLNKAKKIGRVLKLAGHGRRVSEAIFYSPRTTSLLCVGPSR